MGTTSNYNWPYPEATGLVKDGWEDIKDLATAIDTTAASTFTGGLVKINTTTFSAVSSVSLPNNTFTSTYDFYKIIVDAKTASGTASISARLRAAGTDATGSNYNRQFFVASGTGTAASNSVNQTSWDIFLYTVDNVVSYAHNIEIANIAKAAPTTAIITGSRNYGTNVEFTGFNFGHTLSTAYDSMTFITSASTISGAIYVYGFKK